MRMIGVLACLSAAPALADDLPIPSVWENQSGSVLYLDERDTQGNLTGRYVNGAVGYACQGIEYPVRGSVFYPLITFSVVWESLEETCHSITSWTGQYQADTISTEWSLVRWADDGFARYEGESVFHQVEE